LNPKCLSLKKRLSGRGLTMDVDSIAALSKSLSEFSRAVGTTADHMVDALSYAFSAMTPVAVKCDNLKKALDNFRYYKPYVPTNAWFDNGRR